MYANSAVKQYQSINTSAQVVDASPHRLIQMLMEGGLARLAQARGALERGDVAMKGELIGKSLAIIAGLRESLNAEAGGEVAENLDRLYEYMTARIVEANTSNDPQILAEVSGLLLEVKQGWDAIAQS